MSDVYTVELGIHYEGSDTKWAGTSKTKAHSVADSITEGYDTLTIYRWFDGETVELWTRVRGAEGYNHRKRINGSWVDQLR